MDQDLIIKNPFKLAKYREISQWDTQCKSLR